jgi:hypothetical protein
MFHLGTLYQGATVPPDAEVSRVEVLYQGMALAVPKRTEVLYQGTTLAVPKRTEKNGGFSPCLARLESVL